MTALSRRQVLAAAAALPAAGALPSLMAIRDMPVNAMTSRGLFVADSVRAVFDEMRKGVEFFDLYTGGFEIQSGFDYSKSVANARAGLPYDDYLIRRGQDISDLLR